MTKAHTMVLRSGDRFTLAKDYEVELLIVHLGTPPPVVELNGFKLRWSDREFHGTGSFEVRNFGALVEHVTSDTTKLTQRR